MCWVLISLWWRHNFRFQLTGHCGVGCFQKDSSSSMDLELSPKVFFCCIECHCCVNGHDAKDTIDVVCFHLKMCWPEVRREPEYFTINWPQNKTARSNRIYSMRCSIVYRHYSGDELLHIKKGMFTRIYLLVSHVGRSELKDLWFYFIYNIGGTKKNIKSELHQPVFYPPQNSASGLFSASTMWSISPVQGSVRSQSM